MVVFPGSLLSRAPAILALGVLALAPAPAARAGTPDFSIDSIEVTQAIQTGTTTLVAGRSTCVRVRTDLGGVPGPVNLDGLLRVFVGGVETADSPIFSDNGPYPAPASVNPVNEHDTLNFLFIPPLSNDVVLVAEINPAGPNFVAEADTGNNTRSTPTLSFIELALPDMAYSPIDLRPGGGPTPNLPDPNLIRPGVGDNFIQAIYPSHDWDYRRTDAPSKLWESSVAGSGSGLLNSLEVDIELMDPRPDFLYGWVPGGISYNGQAIIGGDVSMGNTQTIRHQRTFAHEVGHNTGLFHNSVQPGVVGVDVERHLAITEELPMMKAANLNDIMVPGLLTPQAWVASGSYANFIGHPAFQAAEAPLADPDLETLMITGLWDRTAGSLALTDSLTFRGGRPTAPAGASEADLLVRAYGDGALLRELPLAVRSSADSCSACAPVTTPESDDDPSAAAPALEGLAEGVATHAPAGDSAAALPEVGFSVVLPARIDGVAIDRLVVVPADGSTGTLQLDRSSARPQVDLATPTRDGQRVLVSWSASDPDGDVLRHYLRYSPDGERQVPLGSSLQRTSLELRVGDLPAPVPGKAYFEVLTSDGLHTTRAVTAPNSLPELAAGGGNAPWIEILSPDRLFTARQGATVLLHCSGWDLEDRSLGGGDIVWSSSVDGVIATGRVTSTASLSVGQHVISAQATDGDGMTSTAFTNIQVLARGLPTVSGDTCQTDLGSGGPGTSQLSVCGGDLSTGTTATLRLIGAPPSTVALIGLGLTNQPTPLGGGLFVPVPWLVLVPTLTSPAGDLVLPGIDGGGGPFSVFTQVILDDDSQTFGIGLSNAVQVDFLP